MLMSSIRRTEMPVKSENEFVSSGDVDMVDCDEDQELKTDDGYLTRSLEEESN